MPEPEQPEPNTVYVGRAAEGGFNPAVFLIYRIDAADQGALPPNSAGAKLPSVTVLDEDGEVGQLERAAAMDGRRAAHPEALDRLGNGVSPADPRVGYLIGEFFLHLLVAGEHTQPIRRDTEHRLGSSNYFLQRAGQPFAVLLITVINIIGGFIIGMTQFGLSAADSGKTYTILCVGDGLVSQLPALLTLTAAGILVSRVDKKL